MAITPRAPRPDRPIVHLTVVRREELSPSMVRVVFSADGFQYAGHADSYVKLLFDGESPVTEAPPERPTTRTYTVRRWDESRRELTVDFVVHGDAGLAGPWAARCEPGDVILARGPGGKWSPPADADFHLFVGDESALPAIESGLDRLSPDAKGLVLVEAAAHTRDLPAPPGVEVRWLVRGEQPYLETRLAEAVAALPWESFGDVSFFAHGERGAVKALRAVCRSRDLPPSRTSLSGYWALGRVEDEFQAEKRTAPELS